jgi:hypothetical protein
MTNQEANPVLTLLARLTQASFEATDLDNQTLLRVRIAALVAEDAPPESYALHFGPGNDFGLQMEDVRAVLLAIAPIVGTTHVMTALGNIAQALGFTFDELMEASADEA